MTGTGMTIRQYLPEDEKEVIELWQRCALTRAWNDPALDIKRKLKVNPELFLVGLINSQLVATAMGGYDGHRGWIYYLAVDPDHQRKGLGRQIMKMVEHKLLDMGCPKLNLQVRDDNKDVVAFYQNIGYRVEERVSMGKRLAEDER